MHYSNIAACLTSVKTLSRGQVAYDIYIVLPSLSLFPSSVALTRLMLRSAAWATGNVYVIHASPC